VADGVRLTRRLLLGALAVLAGSARAMAAGAGGFEGTWGGADGALTAQVIVAGGSVIGFYWRDDYVDTRGASVSPDGSRLTFDFPGGQAVLVRDPGRARATLEVTERGKVTRLELKLD
jgi:hypothetical protein